MNELLLFLLLWLLLFCDDCQTWMVSLVVVQLSVRLAIYLPNAVRGRRGAEIRRPEYVDVSESRLVR